LSRILLIDDDVQVNEVMKATLEVLGHCVMTVDDPQQVAEAFATFHPDVTLVDYMLPGCSGLDMLRDLGNSAPHSIRYLATGMADFSLLKRAMDAGASSFLSKPYRVSDLVALMELADLLTAALRAESAADAVRGGLLRMTCYAMDEDNSAAIGRIITFARGHGADDDVATRRLPVVADALMKNASAYGCVSDTAPYEVKLIDSGTKFDLIVEDKGPGFDWQKALAHARSCMDKPCASGLQLTVALAEEVHYENQGRVACASLSKRVRDTQ
jgi:CheY-like chemotaxis protein